MLLIGFILIGFIFPIELMFFWAEIWLYLKLDVRFLIK